MTFRPAPPLKSAGKGLTVSLWVQRGHLSYDCGHDGLHTVLHILSGRWWIGECTFLLRTHMEMKIREMRADMGREFHVAYC